MTRRSRLLAVTFFSTAMAWVESATVAYLRTLLGRVEPYQQTPLPTLSFLGATELVREVATVVMLSAVAFLAGKSWRERSGYFMVAFGSWDILYYLFLKLIVGWPHTLFDWDVLFLIPLPWWGPVLAPMLISFVLIVGGLLLAFSGGMIPAINPSRVSWLFCLCGLATALYLFMAPSIHAVAGDSRGVTEQLPTAFNWMVFLFALVLISAPIIEAISGAVRRGEV